MRKIILLVLILFAISNCTEKKERVYHPKRDKKFSEALKYSSKITFLIKRANQHEYSRDDSAFDSIEKYAAVNNIQIKKFKSLFSNSVKTAYCPDSKSNYLISFYQREKVIAQYFADTIKLKDSVIVFQGGYQSSEIIGKSNWNSFLKEIKISN